MNWLPIPSVSNQLKLLKWKFPAAVLLGVKDKMCKTMFFLKKIQDKAKRPNDPLCMKSVPAMGENWVRIFLCSFFNLNWPLSHPKLKTWHLFRTSTAPCNSPIVNLKMLCGTLLHFYWTRVRSLAMLVTHWLTDWLTDLLLFSKLDWCDSGMWRWQLKTCWSCCCCWCWWWELCWQQFDAYSGAEAW